MTKNNKIVTLKDLFASPMNFLALGCGSGLIKPAPGTWGSVLAILPFFFIEALAWQWHLLLIVVSFIAGIYLCEACAKYLGVHDHGAIVWDEFVGIWLTLLFIPFTWLNLLLAFGLFRLFDILKPWPIKIFDQKLLGGFGIMFDDILAAVYAWIALQALLQII